VLDLPPTANAEEIASNTPPPNKGEKKQSRKFQGFKLPQGTRYNSPAALELIQHYLPTIGLELVAESPDPKTWGKFTKIVAQCRECGVPPNKIQLGNLQRGL
jgi:hypothetical protein